VLGLGTWPAGAVYSCEMRHTALALVCVLLQGCSSTAAPVSARVENRCNELATRTAVQKFIGAFNAGDSARLEVVLASAETFRWYSTDAPGERFEPHARDRPGMASYVQQRHAQHERLELQRFKFDGVGAGYANFELELTREADDGLPPTPYAAMGAVDCSAQPPTLAVWSMARAANSRAV